MRSGARAFSSWVIVKQPLSCASYTGCTCRTDRIVLQFPSVSRLDDKVSPIPVEAGAVDDVVAPGFQVVPVLHQPVLVVPDEQVGVVQGEEVAGHSFSGPEPLADSLQQLLLPVPFG